MHVRILHEQYAHGDEYAGGDAHANRKPKSLGQRDT